MTAFHALKQFFNDNNVTYRTWELRKQPPEQDFNGDIVVIGSTGDGPYTQFTFDAAGKLISADSCIDYNSDRKQEVVDSVGRPVTKMFNYETGQTEIIKKV